MNPKPSKSTPNPPRKPCRAHGAPRRRASCGLFWFYILFWIRQEDQNWCQIAPGTSQKTPKEASKSKKHVSGNNFMRNLTSDTILVWILLIFHQKRLQKDKENPSQFDIAMRPGTDQLQSLKVQISSHIPMRQRVPPKARKPKKSSSEAQSKVYELKIQTRRPFHEMCALWVSGRSS